MLRKALMVVAVVLLSGCIKPQMLHRNYTNIPASQALVFFSTGAEYKSLSFHTALSLIEAESRRERPLPYFFNASVMRSHFEGEFGHVHTLLLDEGTYYLAPRAGNDMYQCIGLRPQFKFSVRGGEVVYLGSFLLTGGNEVRHSASGNRPRDEEYFLKRNPALANVQITTPVVEGSQDTRGEQC